MVDVKISIVSPVYEAENLIEELVTRIEESVGAITTDFEILLVEDGSIDNSWSKIEQVCQKNPKVKGVRLSRNFGQHYAITAGLKESKGEWIVVMDCDLQDNPKEIKKLYEKALEGNDIVLAQRILRVDSYAKKFSSKLFYKIFGYLTDTKQDASVANYGVYNKKVISAILEMGDYYRYFPTMVQWVGFKKCYVSVEHSSRAEGGSSYTFKRLVSLAFDNIIAFSDKPLRLTIKLGLLVILTAMFFGIYTIYMYFTEQITEIGYASLVLSIWFLSGVIIFILGIIGVYLGKSFETIKERPSFIIDQKINFHEK